MRRFLAAAFMAILLLAMPLDISVFATTKKYDLDEMGLQVTIPSGYSVITRDTPENDSIFNELGTTKSAIVSQFETSNIYLNAISNTYNEEVVVTNLKNELSNFSLLSDTILNVFAETLVNQYKNYGINVSKYEIYQHSQAKFIKVYFTDTANSVYGLQYYTIYDGNAMNFTIRSYEGRLSSRQEATIKTIVDSVKYDKAPPVSEEKPETNQFTYTHTESGVKFVVPANWQQEELYKDRETIDAKFVSTKEDGCAIMYGGKDLWAELSEEERKGLNRSDINNSMTKSVVAEMCSTTTDKVSVATYNGIQYCKIESKSSKEIKDINISFNTTELIYIDNGWMYTFHFSGTSTHKLYSDFERLLSSVQYPIVPNVGEIGLNSNTDFNSSNKSLDNNSSTTSMILLLAVTGMIVALVVILRKRATANNPCTLKNNTYTPEPSSNAEPTVFCNSCGQTLPIESSFCHICGKKIEKDD